jgi:hypothetical protein
MYTTRHRIGRLKFGTSVSVQDSLLTTINIDQWPIHIHHQRIISWSGNNHRCRYTTVNHRSARELPSAALYSLDDVTTLSSESRPYQHSSLNAVQNNSIPALFWLAVLSLHSCALTEYLHLCIEVAWVDLAFSSLTDYCTLRWPARYVFHLTCPLIQYGTHTNDAKTSICISFLRNDVSELAESWN